MKTENDLSPEVEFLKNRLNKVEKIIEMLSKNQKRLTYNLKKSMNHQRLVFEDVKGGCHHESN